MSCYILTDTNIKTIAANIYKLHNAGYNLPLPEYFWNMPVDEIASALYETNCAAYNGRYETETAPAPIEWNTVKAADVLRPVPFGTVTQEHFDFYSLLNCYLYQISETPVYKGELWQAVNELCDSIARYIIHNDKRMPRGWKTY